MLSTPAGYANSAHHQSKLPRVHDLSNDHAKRIALAAQGFAEPRPRKPGADEMKALIRRLHLIQIDSVNVLVRAHYMPFFSRLGPYPRELLEHIAYRDRFAFEQWAHEACFIPLEDYPLFRHRMSRGRRWSPGSVTPALIESYDRVLEHVRDNGPVVTGDLDAAGKRAGWWGWSDSKNALEYHFAIGNLAVRERRNFARIYDLAERVFPPETLAPPPFDDAEAMRRMLRNSLAALGVATAKDLADYYRFKVTAIRPLIQDLVDAGDAVPVRVEGWKDQAYLAPGIAHTPEVSATALLSPFDNLVWDRDRTERMFGFFYRIEIYTPAHKRVHGYCVLPFMHGNELVARVDLKANRQESTLEVRASHLEPGAKASRTASALARELKTMQRWLGLERISVWSNGDLSAPLIRALGPANTIRDTP